MKIHYSPFFDGNVYIDYKKRGNIVFDEIFVGDAGLLSELELRIGLSTKILSQPERIAYYAGVLNKVFQKDPGLFIKGSFETDEFGTASEILRWRDELITAGWTTNITGNSEKLRLLAKAEKVAIENKINIKGISDRIKALTKYKGSLLHNDNELIVHFPKEHLPPHIVLLFEKIPSCKYISYDKAIADKKTNLHKVQNSLLNQKKVKLDLKDTDSVSILEFNRQDSAYEYLANEDYKDDNVFINSDNRTFDEYQFLYGNAFSGSKLKDANPEIIQLFKLGCSLFIKPLNIYNLLSYLQISRHPLPSVLRRQLIDVITEQGGIINKEWNKAIDEFFEKEKKKEKGKNRDILVFLPINHKEDTEINKAELIKYIKNLKNWSTKQLILQSNKKNNESTDEIYDTSESNDVTEDKTEAFIIEQTVSLMNFCETFLIILRDHADETINIDKFKSWILSVYEPKTYKFTEAQTGSQKVIESSAAIADYVKELVWTDCNGGEVQARFLNFLNESECQFLENNGVNIWGTDAQIRSALFAQLFPVLNCTDKLVLISSKKGKGASLNKHPLMIRIEALCENIDEFLQKDSLSNADMIELNKINLPENKLYIETGKKNMFPPRERESYSSLSDLIQNPLDYVLRYHAKLEDKSVIQLSDEKRTEGNVAHHFIHTIIEDSEKELNKINNLLNSEYEKRFIKVVTEKGAVLLSEQNKIRLTSFKRTLRNSLHDLFEIIEKNNLKITGSETEDVVEHKDKKIKLYAGVDLLLTDRNGNHIIFDLKWTSSKTYYYNLMKENRALQLEVYKHVLEKTVHVNNVSIVAYFDLKHSLLYSSRKFEPGICQIETENSDDIFEQAMNSYTYRYKELDKGIIESAEEMLLEDINYYTDTEKSALFPLKNGYNDKKAKAVNNFSSFKTFKGKLL